MPKLDSKVACITGASSGIGLGTAEALAQMGFRLFIGARRTERLEASLPKLLELGSPEVRFSRLDVSDRESITEFHRAFVHAFGSAPNVLVNNAGLARGRDPIAKAKLDDWKEMIDANVAGLMLVTHAFLPAMMAKMAGDIVMIGSIAGTQPYEGGSVYCATKAAVTAFTNCLRLEVNGSNIRVIQVDPGLVETEFSVVRLRDQTMADKVYEGVVPLTGHDVGKSIAYAVGLPAHICISNFTIMPTQQASVAKVHRSSI